MSKSAPAEQAIRDIRRKTRKRYSAEEKIRIVLSGLRSEESIAALCHWALSIRSLYWRRGISMTRSLPIRARR